MKKLFFAIVFALLPLAAALAQPTLVYQLLPDSTITPMTDGVASGPAQPLTGSFSWQGRFPSTLQGSDEFAVTALNFSNASYHFTWTNTTQEPSSTRIANNGSTTFFAAVTWSESSTNPWGISGLEPDGDYVGPGLTPTRLTFAQGGLIRPGEAQAASFYLDAELVGSPANPFPNIVTISATAQSQQATNTASSGNSTIPNPLKSRIDTKQILAWLAQDEYAAGHYGYTNFPDGAQLIYIPFFAGLEDSVFFSGPATQILDKNGELIIDTSDILTVQDGNNHVFSGKLRPDNAAYNPTGKELHFIRVTYDDSALTNGVGLQFNLQGLMTTAFNDSKPTSVLTFNRTATGNADAAGDGSLNGVPFVLTGSIDTKQKIELTY